MCPEERMRWWGKMSWSLQVLLPEEKGFKERSKGPYQAVTSVSFRFAANHRGFAKSKRAIQWSRCWQLWFWGQWKFLNPWTCLKETTGLMCALHIRRILFEIIVLQVILRQLMSRILEILYLGINKTKSIFFQSEKVTYWDILGTLKVGLPV